MAALALRSPGLSLPSIISPLGQHIRALPVIQRIRTFYPFSQSFVIPIGALSGVSSWLGDIWDSVLKAVPKKKTSHMKKRHRQMAGKALKDVTALNTCSSCGRTKRAHILCPYCALAIRNWLTGEAPKNNHLKHGLYHQKESLKRLQKDSQGSTRDAPAAG